MPDKSIPELTYLDGAAWARAAQSAKLDTEADMREALSNLRNLAKQTFAPQMARALQAYARANAGLLPTDTSQLKSYFESPVDDAALARYQVIGSGSVTDLHPLQMIVAERAAVDDQYDTLFQISLNGRKTVGIGKGGNFAETVAWSSGTPQFPAGGK